MTMHPSDTAAPAIEAGAPGPKPASNDIPIALKSSLVDSGGVPYREFRNGLRPRWWLVWAHIALAYAALAGCLAALVAWDPGLPLAALAALGGAVLVGYLLQFLSNFMHEAGHHNLLPGRRANDLVADLLLGWLLGSSVASYRRVHFQHHRALGTTEDSEISYFDALGIRYIVGSLLGVKAIEASRRRARVDREQDADAETRRSSRLAWVCWAAAVNLGLAAALVALGSVVAAAAWIAGLLVFFPFFSSLRQLLEHRSEEAEAGVDYTRVDHGAVNRLFGEGPLSSTYGSAGFNRHALHHWEPNVSYTRLKDIEDYLRRTEVADMVEARQTSYPAIFLRLLEL
jgi:fatty acid desaturase